MRQRSPRLLIGIGGSIRQQLWRDAAAAIDDLWLLSLHKTEYWIDAGLDLEIMAPSLVVAPLGLALPVDCARTYEFAADSGYAPIVIVPPTLNPTHWPTGLPDPPAPGVPDLGMYRQRYSYEIALYMWRQIFCELQRIRAKKGKTLSIGFHCDTIAYYSSDGQADLRAFQDAYAEIADLATVA